METYKYTFSESQTESIINRISRDLGVKTIEELESKGVTFIPDKKHDGWYEITVTPADDDMDELIYDSMRKVCDDPEIVSTDNKDFIEGCLDAPDNIDVNDLYEYIAESIVNGSSEIDVYLPSPTFGRARFSVLSNNEMKIEVLSNLCDNSWEVSHEIDNELRERNYPFDQEFVSAIKVNADNPYYLIYERDF